MNTDERQIIQMKVGEARGILGAAQLMLFVGNIDQVLELQKQAMQILSSITETIKADGERK